ncbi:MAG: hypothetical protein R2709_07690 [Marmoricola sp.]
MVRVKPGPRLGLFLLLLATLLVASLLRHSRLELAWSDRHQLAVMPSSEPALLRRFPDPTVVRVGHNYYAYGTTINYLNLPVLQSRDLLTWTARASNDPNRWWLNDAMPTTGSWSRIKRLVGVHWVDVGATCHSSRPLLLGGLLFTRC